LIDVLNLKGDEFGEDKLPESLRNVAEREHRPS
jgi:hypothetical protein